MVGEDKREMGINGGTGGRCLMLFDMFIGKGPTW